jgi:Xaa-Pro aminopeptidase
MNSSLTKRLILFLGLTLSWVTSAQNLKLSKDFFQQRRNEVIKKMPPNSVAVFFSNPVRNRSNDVDYHYHQDPDFYYLTGLKEPNSVLLLFSTPQPSENGSAYNSLLFCQPKNPRIEMWNGRILGIEGCKDDLGFEAVQHNTEFEKFNFSGFSKILFLPKIENAGDDKPQDKYDLYSLINQFKAAAKIPADFTIQKYKAYDIIKSSNEGNSHAVTNIITRELLFNPDLQNDKLITGFNKSQTIKDRENIRKKIPEIKWDGHSLDDILDELREIKTPEELKILTRAIEISAIGQIEIMKALDTTYSEREIQGVHEFVYKKYGAAHEGYPSIIGAGKNGCILHYTENSIPKVGNKLVLMDAGAEYEGYTADITRTIPANGKFTSEQKAVYELVLKAQNAGISLCKAGNNFRASHDTAFKIISKGLLELGITKSEKQTSKFFPHGSSHYLGLDVHDRGTFGVLKPNSVITVEPGIYIPIGSDCDKKWWGIAVRIEDDILITENEPIILSGKAPRTVEEIEKLMAQKSVLNELVLPELD